jgi:hypothetical protein
MPSRPTCPRARAKPPRRRQGAVARRETSAACRPAGHDQGMLRSCRHGIDIRSVLRAATRSKASRRSLCRGAARRRRDPDRQDQSAAADDLHRDRQSALRTHQQSVGSGAVVRRLERRRSGRDRRRRLAARPRQRHRRLAAHSRGVLRHHIDPADRGPHCPIIAPTACRSARPESSAKSARWRGTSKTWSVGLRVLDRARDPFVVPGPELGDPAGVDISGLRFATFTDDGEFPVAPAARRAVVEAAQMLTAAGAQRGGLAAAVLSRAVDLLFASLSADRTQTFRRLLRGNRVDRRVRPLLLTAAMPLVAARHCRSHPRRLRSAAPRCESAALRFRQCRRLLADNRGDRRFPQALLRAFDEAEGGPIDVILCPAYAVPAVRHGATE